MSQSSPKPHPFDAEGGPSVIDYGGTRVAIRPSTGEQSPASSDIHSIRREVRHMARQLEGMAKAIWRLDRRIKEAALD